MTPKTEQQKKKKINWTSGKLKTFIMKVKRQPAEWKRGGKVSGARLASRQGTGSRDHVGDLGF